MMTGETIRVVTAAAGGVAPEATATSGRKDPIGVAASLWAEAGESASPALPEEPGLRFQDVPAAVLEESLTQLLAVLDRTVQRAAAQANMQALVLEEAVISVGVAANGSLAVLGIGAGVAGTTSIALKFKPKP